MNGLDDAATLPQRQATDLVALDEALKELGVLDARKSKIVEMRYFGGMTLEETAEALGISTATVSRDWNTAKAWLLRAMSPKTRANNSV
jgi:RNA polymerase sigma factor (sigma-70 family)